MIELHENVYKGKPAIKCATGIINNVNKIHKYSEAKINDLKEQEKAWKETEEYKTWEKDYAEREDDDVFRYDPDPKGWEILNSALN